MYLEQFTEQVPEPARPRERHRGVPADRRAAAQEPGERRLSRSSSSRTSARRRSASSSAIRRSSRSRNYNESNAINWLTEQTVTYDRTSGRHHAQLLGGFSVQANREPRRKLPGHQLPERRHPDAERGDAHHAATPMRSAGGWCRTLARLNYDFADGKYLASAAIRRDGSSRFAEQNRWGVFPSAVASAGG